MTDRAADTERALFNAAVELTPEKRSAFLAKACSGEAAIERRLLRLLAANDEAEEALSRVLSVRSARCFVFGPMCGPF